MNRALTPHRGTARVVGILILGGYLSYGLGSSITTEITTAPGYLPQASDGPTIAAAALMMLVNSGLVIAIGILLYPVLAAHSPRIALGYFATRLFEGVLMAIGIMGVMALAALGATSAPMEPQGLESLTGLLITGNLIAYNIAMLGLSIGSLFLCVLLYRSRLVPRFIGVWGFVGYAVLAAGSVLELLGFAGAGLVATIPGGLWEVFFAGWLIVKGFAPANVIAPIARASAVAS